MKAGPLRSGFTTGTCAAAAAKAAATMLLGGHKVREVSVMTPAKTLAVMAVSACGFDGSQAYCAVIKDAGDDPDVTDGVLLFAEVYYIEQVDQFDFTRYYSHKCYPRVYLTGGQGIGTVTRKGLACPVGMPAINPVPQDMILRAVSEVLEAEACSRSVGITIRIPKGRELAQKTFNPVLGIEGGISVLGTSGIVKPMSEQALLETIRLDIRVKAAAGMECLAMTPGNYGETFLMESLGLSLNQAVKCSNFIGDGLLMMKEEGIHSVILAGHIGKLVKTAGGVWNTHSKYGDRRMEILAECVKEAGVCEAEILKGLKAQILKSNTTEEAAEFLETAGILRAVGNYVAEKIRRQGIVWTNGGVELEVMTFSNVYGILGMTKGAEAMAKKVKTYRE